MRWDEIAWMLLLGLSNLSLMAVFIVYLILSRRERHDLYNRFMSANIGDYMRLSEKETPKKDIRMSAHKKAIAAFHASGTGIKPE